VLQERVYRTKISDVDELKRRIISEWAALSHTIIDSTVTERRQRLRACVHAGGGHFEHTLKYRLYDVTHTTVTILRDNNCQLRLLQFG